MCILNLIQIPCHHVLANEIDLNLKYHIGLKHSFNINLGICIIKKKLLFLFVFSTYLPFFLLKFRSGELVGCEIKFRIQRVPTWHTFNGPRYPKNKKSSSHFFQVFLIFGIARSVKSMPSWYSLDAKFKSSPDQNLSKNRGRYVKNTNKKVVFFFSSSKINKYYFIILTIILLVHFRRPILTWNFL